MKEENGFTILEALFAMAIFAVAMLGVIGLQLNSLQTDEETRRKDMAAQLLTAGAEMVACSDYGSTALYSVAESGFSGFAEDVKNEPIPNSLLTWGGGKASLYLRHQRSAGPVTIRNVYLVAAWDSIKTGQRETLSRMMVKPQNMLQ